MMSCFVQTLFFFCRQNLANNVKITCQNDQKSTAKKARPAVKSGIDLAFFAWFFLSPTPIKSNFLKLSALFCRATAPICSQFSAKNRISPDKAYFWESVKLRFGQIGRETKA
eukprot:sb/3477082/